MKIIIVSIVVEQGRNWKIRVFNISQITVSNEQREVKIAQQVLKEV